VKAASIPNPPARKFRASPDSGSKPALFRAQRPAPSVGAMKDRIDITALVEEIRRYLAAVDAFRALGCEPTWRAES
jgi:hypothetical protein